MPLLGKGDCARKSAWSQLSMSSLLVMVPECGQSPRTTRTRLDLPQPLLPMMRRLLRARTVTLSPVSRSGPAPSQEAGS